MLAVNMVSKMMTFSSRMVRRQSYWEMPMMSLCWVASHTACRSAFVMIWSLRHGHWPYVGALGEVFSSMRVRR